MNNETILNDGNDAERAFETIAVDLLSGLLGALIIDFIENREQVRESFPGL